MEPQQKGMPPTKTETIQLSPKRETHYRSPGEMPGVFHLREQPYEMNRVLRHVCAAGHLRRIRSSHRLAQRQYSICNFLWCVLDFV